MFCSKTNTQLVTLGRALRLKGMREAHVTGHCSNPYPQPGRRNSKRSTFISIKHFAHGLFERVLCLQLLLTLWKHGGCWLASNLMWLREKRTSSDSWIIVPFTASQVVAPRRTMLRRKRMYWTYFLWRRAICMSAFSGGSLSFVKRAGALLIVFTHIAPHLDSSPQHQLFIYCRRRQRWASKPCF